MKQQREKMNIMQAKEAISLATKLYFTQDAQGNYIVDRRRARPLCLMGPAGIGKTEIVAQVAKEQGLALCSYSLVHHTRQSLLGLPRLETQVIGGEEVSCTRYTMSEIIDAIYGEMQKTGKDKGILFLDEFNCANESIRPVMLQLLQDKSLGTHLLPPGWMLVLAGNPTKYNKSAKDLDAVTMDRLRILQLEACLDTWLPYARQRGVHPTILHFLEENPKFFYEYQPGNWDSQGSLYTPRGWEDMSIQLGMMEEIGAELTHHFIAQFFQSTTLVNTFYLYYRRYAVLAGSGLVDRIFQRDPSAIAEVTALATQDRWALTSAVLSRIKKLAIDTTLEGDLVDHLYDSLKSNREQLKQGGAKAVELLYSLAENEAHPSATQKLLAYSDHVGAVQGWNDITTYFKEHDVQPYQAQLEQAHSHIDNALFIFNEALRDAENPEKLLHSIVEEEIVSKFVAKGNIPAFKTLCINTHFQDNNNILAMDNQAEAM